MDQHQQTDYELVDSDTGMVFSIKVPKADVLALDYDKDRRFRLLEALKQKNVAPIYQWDVSYSVVPSTSAESHSPSTSGQTCEPLATSSPILIRATGKTGGVWKDDRLITAFLQECLKRKQSMQARTVEEGVYQEISDALFAKNINYSSGQLRCKMKSLRRQFNEAKNKGMHGGSKWRFFSYMDSLYPVPTPQLVIEEDCTTGLEHFESFSINTSATDGASQNVKLATDRASQIVNLSTNGASQNDNLETYADSQNGFSLDLNASSFLDHCLQPDNEDKNESQPNSGLGYNSFLWHDDDNLESAEKAGEENNNGDLQPEVVPQRKTPVNSPINSPARKKKKNDNGGIDAGSKTPRKTPRKSAVQSQLVWAAEPTKAFVKLCVQYKSEVQLDNPPLSVWKKISAELDHPNLNWQICRSKFMYMNTFFSDTLLPNRGVLSGVKWPHYEDFCVIHDLPTDYLLPEITPQVTTDSTTLWEDHNRCLLLISQYKERYPTFKSSKSMVRHSTLYKEIAGTLAMFDVPCNEKQCESKIKALEGKFRSEYDRTRGTGQAPSTWPYYKPMLEIYDGNSTLEPCLAYSVGSSQQFLIKGKKVVEDTASRIRQPQPGSSKAHSKRKEPKSKIYKNDIDELKERQIAATEAMAREMMLLREGIDASNARRFPVMESLASSVAQMVKLEEEAKKKAVTE